MAKNLFTLTVKTTTPADSELLVGGTGSANAYNFTWTKLKEWVANLGTNALIAGSGTFSGLITNTLSSTRTDQFIINGGGSTSKGHVGQLSNALWLSSNYYYLSGEQNDDNSNGQVAIRLFSGTTNTSFIRFLTSNAGTSVPLERYTIDADGNNTWSGEMKSTGMPTASGGLASGTLWASSNVINIIP